MEERKRLLHLYAVTRRRAEEQAVDGARWVLAGVEKHETVRVGLDFDARGRRHGVVCSSNRALGGAWFGPLVFRGGEG